MESMLEKISGEMMVLTKKQKRILKNDYKTNYIFRRSFNDFSVERRIVVSSLIDCALHRTSIYYSKKIVSLLKKKTSLKNKHFLIREQAVEIGYHRIAVEAKIRSCNYYVKMYREKTIPPVLRRCYEK